MAIINDYDRTLQAFQQRHHSRCLFQRDTLVKKLAFSFSSDGVLEGTFVCSEKHQGYDNIVHGGVIAAIVDASMAQCCLGHGVVAYTGDLKIRYRNPLRIGLPTQVKTRIVKKRRGVLYALECCLTQNGRIHVTAEGRFFQNTKATS